MNKIVYLLFICFFSLSAQNKDLFQEANTAYNEGNYSGAINNYERILENGETSAELYYNLANAHYKLSHIAPSIYYYEKALQLNPGDSDVKNNLEFAQRMLMDEIEEVPKTGLLKITNKLISVLSFNGWAWTAVIGSVLFAAFFLLYYFSNSSRRKRFFFTTSIIALIIMLSALIFAFQQQNYHKNSRFAIIFSEEAIIRNEPTLRSNEILMLHEGTKVKILETFQNWIKFELANKIQGWMDKSDVRFL
ncbi:MAG TPA: tetratricopeptide repeat protein [Gillisia sp.]|nr:tetratricopeptide repeat protein [Gillisia sp.]